MDTKNDNGIKQQLKDHNPENNAPTPTLLLADREENEGKEQDLSAQAELPNIDIKDSMASGLLQMDNREKENENIESINFDSIPFLENSMGKRRKASKKYLTPKFPEIILNEGRNLKEESWPQIPLSFPTYSSQFIESKEVENWHFLMDAQSPRSGSPVGSPGSPTPSVYHDALGDKDEDWKVTGGSLVGVGLGINLGQRHDESTKRHQHDMLVRTQDSNANLQGELEESQRKIMIAKQQTAKNKTKLTEWQVSKEKYYEEIQRINDEHVSEFNAQKEALQKAMKIEIGLEKAQLVQEFSSRISQEVTKGCKKQELRIKHLSRTIKNLRGEKQEQEMDMEAYREKIADQGEELLKANRRVLELEHSLKGRKQEVERLHAKIGGLEKRSIEAQSLAEQTVKELQKSKRELEDYKTKVDYAQDSTSDDKTEFESESRVRHWNFGRRTAEPNNRELELKILSEKLAEGKELIESQSCQINLLSEEIAKLAKIHEEDDTKIKSQRRKHHSLKQSLFPLKESFEKLTDQFHNLKRTEEQGRATIKQLQNEIDEFEATRAQLKEAHESLIAKETDLNETVIKLQHHEAVIMQQQKEIDELVVTRARLKEAQESVDSKQTELKETMIKLERDKTIIKQQQGEIQELAITRARLKKLQECLSAKHTYLEKTSIELEQANQELQNLRREQKGKANATLEEPLKSNQARAALVARSINSGRNAGATSSYVNKQNPLPNVGESGHWLAIPNINNSATSAPHDVKLFGAEDISKEIEEDYYYYDDGHESVHEILRRAVAGGAAILRKLEMMPIGL